MYSAGTLKVNFTRRSRRSETGAQYFRTGRIRSFAIFVAFKLVPPYVSEYQLQDKMQEVARFAIVNRYSDEQVRDNMFKVVQDLGVPVKREEIKVYISQATCKIAVDYTVPVDLMFYSTDLHFSPSSENKSLM